MTAVLETDRIAMADESDELTLDKMFETLEKMPVPEGIKVEIVEGNIFMSPQRDTHWTITLDIIRQLDGTYAYNKIKSDVRFDFPGHLNGFACDVVALSKDATMDAKKHWHYSDIEFVAEVISKGTAANDYGPKKATYAAAGVPVYVIADPYTGRCHVYTEPKGDEYSTELTVAFGTDIDLTGTPVGLTLKTGEFPRD
ncbi:MULTISPECIES: Uma2 family endonuclease [unclassified Streptomyces]|uniref:Uma2 family endonuclease n=1 Tax=unclassified Streptomyces TaxID=2593676 RepID=UPI0004C8B460|nr:Uma2 family endonuclease [Streptomyces sp. NRRL F-5135]